MNGDVRDQEATASIEVPNDQNNRRKKRERRL